MKDSDDIQSAARQVRGKPKCQPLERSQLTDSRQRVQSNTADHLLAGAQKAGAQKAGAQKAGAQKVSGGAQKVSGEHKRCQGEHKRCQGEHKRCQEPFIWFSADKLRIQHSIHGDHFRDHCNGQYRGIRNQSRNSGDLADEKRSFDFRLSAGFIEHLEQRHRHRRWQYQSLGHRMAASRYQFGRFWIDYPG
jgi:hypothetical protein